MYFTERFRQRKPENNQIFVPFVCVWGTFIALRAKETLPHFVVMRAFRRRWPLPRPLPLCPVESPCLPVRLWQIKARANGAQGRRACILSSTSKTSALNGWHETSTFWTERQTSTFWTERQTSTFSHFAMGQAKAFGRDRGEKGSKSLCESWRVSIKRAGRARRLPPST